MKQKRWVGAAAASVCLLAAAFLLWPRGTRTIEAARASVKEAVPLDFDALQAVNGDIYAWLHIPGAGISEPLLQRKEDSFYYLTHDCTGDASDAGALFTESAYNQTDFSDAATVIYGKNTPREGLFGNLQPAYSSSDDLKKNEEIIIFLPGRSIRYQVFAAVPFRNYHLLHYFNFSNETRYQAFLQAVRSVKAIDANWNEDVIVAPGDPLLILSTNRFGNSNDIYLVLAKRLLD